MDELDQKLESILGNPDIMQQIMQLANQLEKPSVGKNNTSETNEPEKKPSPAPLPADALHGLSALLSSASVDKNQQALLNALKPYISEIKVRKLEKAIQAAKMAQLASGYLNNGGLRQLIGG